MAIHRLEGDGFVHIATLAANVPNEVVGEFLEPEVYPGTPVATDGYVALSALVHEGKAVYRPRRKGVPNHPERREQGIVFIFKRSCVDSQGDIEPAVESPAQPQHE